METIDNRSFKQKASDWWWNTKYKAKCKWENTKKFCRENKAEVVAISLVAIPAVSGMVKRGLNAYAEHEETSRRETDYYDPRTGEHWRTRRPLRTSEKLELEERYEEGESKGSILNDMNLLRRR